MIRNILPGALLAVAVALVARGSHGLLPPTLARAVGEVVLAVLLGLLLANAVRLPAALTPGFRFSFQTVLRFAIVLLGARLSLHQIAAIGGRAVVLIVVLMTLAVALAHALGRLAGVSTRLAALIGIGTAVCGNSAISATAPVIGARDDEVSFAIATNTLFGTLAIFLYPVLGMALGLDDAQYGTWAGTAVNDTSQVVAAGFAFSEPAGEVATAVKLTRNALMGLVIVAMGFLYPPADAAVPRKIPFLRRVRQSLPPFVVGFVVMALLRTLGFFDDLSATLNVELVALFSGTSKFLILMALAGVGLGTRLEDLRRTGLKPFYIGLTVAAAVSCTSLLLISLLGAAG